VPCFGGGAYNETAEVKREKTHLDYSPISWRLPSFHCSVYRQNKLLAGKTQVSIQNGCIAKRETNKKEELKCTSVFCPFHVEPCLIRLEIFRSCFFGSIVQFAEVLTNNEIVALTRDFFGTPEIAALMPFNLVRFKGVASEEHSSNGVFRCRLTLKSSLKYTNPEHQERN